MIQFILGAFFGAFVTFAIMAFIIAGIDNQKSNKL